MIKKKIKMDLSINNAPQVVYAVQGDTNTRNVVIDLYNAGSAWTVPDGASGVVKFQKADGKGGIYDKLPNGFPAVVYEENSNQIEVSLAPQVLTFPGEVKAQVSLIYDNNIISTFSFVVLVQADSSANAEKSTDYVNWDRYFIPQTSGATVGQYLKITKVDDSGRVVEVSPVDSPSNSGAIDGDLDMKSDSILNVGTVEFWNEDELAKVIMQSEFPEGDNESENFNGVIEFRTSRGDEPVVIRNVADAKNPNEAVSKKQLDESMDHKKLSNRDAADQHPIEAITGLKEILEEVKNGSDGGNGSGSVVGISGTARNLLMEVLRSATYKTDSGIEEKLSDLEKALTANSENGDGGEGSVERYTVTYMLSGVSSNNGDTEVESGAQYYAVLTPVDSTHVIQSVEITMGGVDVTSSYYDADTGVISIPSVIGAVVITSVAGEQGLPDSGYTRYDYITKSIDTNVADAYINTEINGDFAKDYDLTITLQRGSDDVDVWYTLGCRDSAAVSPKSYAMWIKPNEMAFQYCGSEHTIHHDFTKKTILRTHNGRIYVDDELKIETSVNDDTDYYVVNPFYLFSLFQGAPNGGFKGKVYEMVVKNADGEYVAKLVPATDGSGVSGLYDVIRKKFYFNCDTSVSGSGFVCGNDE